MRGHTMSMKPLQIAASLSVVIIGASLWLLTPSFSSPAESANMRSSEGVMSEEYWSARIRAVGGKKAHDEMALEAASMNPSDQHGIAHFFGGALYSVEGVDGIDSCDDRFTNGCAHQFMGEALVEQGTAAARTLDERCRETDAWNDCEHSLGHGFMSHFGYEDAGFRDALQACDILGSYNEFYKCESGVFMEYALQNNLGPDGHPRERGERSWLYPCDTVPDDLARVCMRYQAKWWWVYLKAEGIVDDGERVKEMGQFCRGADGALRRACFEGIGEIIVDPHYEPAVTIAHCARASSDLADQLPCRISAANVFRQISEDAALDVCSGLIGEARPFCEMHARGEVEDQKILPLPL